jgi:hypothetical protein
LPKHLTRRNVVLAAGAAAASAFCVGLGNPPLRAATPSRFKQTMTTLFWVGEPSGAENAFIPNHESYWDRDWQQHYGGIDHPWERNGHLPAGFTPNENPFYVALPFGEFAADGALKTEAQLVPWYSPGLKPLLKNRWVAVRANGRDCYAQWEDVGPFGEEDFAFVFGDAALPRNALNDRAGLDVSPAVWHYLGMKENGLAAWRFVDPSEVPAGPWSEIVTASADDR